MENYKEEVFNYYFENQISKEDLKKTIEVLKIVYDGRICYCDNYTYPEDLEKDEKKKLNNIKKVIKDLKEFLWLIL